MTQRELPSHQEIVALFEALPCGELLTYAHGVQQRLLAGETLSSKKDTDDPDSWVTLADTWIQERIISYFESSNLSGLYLIIAEESLHTEQAPGNKPYTLIIDPLDGTSPFRKGSSEWGIMVALYAHENSQQYSWNLLSDGSLYTSYLPTPANLGLRPDSMVDATPTTTAFNIDHCAYGAEDLDVLESKLAQILKIPPLSVAVYANPTAVVVGYQLLQGKLDALLWVASDKGKRIIPVYDLLFLKALPSNRFITRLAIGEEGITLVVVARTEEVATALIRTAELLPWARLGQNQPSTLDSVVWSLRPS